MRPRKLHPSMLETSISNKAGEIVGYAKAYADQHVRLLKLDIAERFSKLTAGLVTVMLGFILLLFVLLLLSIGAGIFLGEVMDSYGLAFMTLAGSYALVGLLLYFTRRWWLVNPLLSLVIQEILSEDEDQ